MHAVLGTFVKGILGPGTFVKCILHPRGMGVGLSNDADAHTNGSDVRHSQYLAVWASANLDCADIIQTIICMNNKTNLLYRALR